MRVVAVLGLAALALAGAGYAVLAGLELPAPTLGPQAIEPAAGPARRVLVVVLDGLGQEAAARLPALRALARRGASGVLLSQPPTFSSPQYVAFLTGVGPVDSGVRTNLRPRPLPLDSVVAAVRRRGGRAVEVGDEVDWWGRFFAWDDARVVAPAGLVSEARRLMADARNELVLVHVTGINQAGHARGAASEEYRAAAEASDRQVEALAAGWEGPLVVLSDHGHMPRGGHGGTQAAVRRAFVVLAGPGVRAVVLPDAGTADVAPTLAALLGVPAPAQALGTTILEALEIDEARRVSHARAETVRLARLVPLAAAGRQRLAAAERRMQLARALAALAALVAAGWWVRRQGSPALRGLVHGATAAALLALLVWLDAGTPSFGGFRNLRQLGLETGLAGLAAGLIALGGPLRAAVRGGLAPGAAAALAGGAALGAAPPAAAAFVLAGVLGPRFSCRPDWLAAGPTIAYLGLAPVLVCAAAIVLAARRRH